MKSKWEATATATATTTFGAAIPSPTVWKDLGCFEDTPIAPFVLLRNMNSPNDVGPDKHLTIGKCKDTCFRNEYGYAGVKQGDQCWCSGYLNIERKYSGKLAENQADCNVPCTGDKSSMCGGKGFVKVFMAELEGYEPQDLGNGVGETLPQITTDAVPTSTVTGGGGIGGSTSGSTSTSTGAVAEETRASSGARRNMALFWR